MSVLDRACCPRCLRAFAEGSDGHHGGHGGRDGIGRLRAFAEGTYAHLCPQCARRFKETYLLMRDAGVPEHEVGYTRLSSRLLDGAWRHVAGARAADYLWEGFWRAVPAHLVVGVEPRPFPFALIEGEQPATGERVHQLWEQHVHWRGGRQYLVARWAPDVGEYPLGWMGRATDGSMPDKDRWRDTPALLGFVNRRGDGRPEGSGYFSSADECREALVRTLLHQLQTDSPTSQEAVAEYLADNVLKQRIRGDKDGPSGRGVRQWIADFGLPPWRELQAEARRRRLAV